MVLAADSALNQLISRYPELRSADGKVVWSPLVFAKATHELERIVRMSYGITQAPGIFYSGLQKLLTPSGRFRQLEVATPSGTFEAYTLQTLLEFTTQTLFPPKLLETTARQALEQPYESASHMTVRVVLDELRTLAMLVPNRAPRMAQDLMRIFEANRSVFVDSTKFHMLSVELMKADATMEHSPEATPDSSFQLLNQILAEWSITTNFSGAQSPDTTMIAFTTRSPRVESGSLSTVPELRDTFQIARTGPPVVLAHLGPPTTTSDWATTQAAKFMAELPQPPPQVPSILKPSEAGTLPQAPPGEQERLLRLMWDRMQSWEREVQQNKRPRAVLAMDEHSEGESKSDNEMDQPAKRTRFNLPPKQHDGYTPGPPLSPYSDRPPKPCRTCGDNHWHSDCPVRRRQYRGYSPHRGERPTGGRSPRGQYPRFSQDCFLCRAPDHFARDCPLKYQLDPAGPRAPPVASPNPPNPATVKSAEEVMVVIMGKDGTTTTVPKAAMDMFKHQTAIQKMLGQ